MVFHTLFVCAVACWLVACLLEVPTIGQAYNLIFAMVLYALVSFILAAALFIVSDLTGHALRILWRLQGRRIAPDTAWHIIGVASVGWVLTYGIWLAAWSGIEIWRIIDPPPTDFELRQRVGFEIEYIQMPAFFGGFAAGLAVFAGYTLLGLHRLRYANRARPVMTATHAAD